MSDELRAILTWIIERLLIDPQDDRCDRCGHSGHFHRLDDSQNVSPDDPTALFRCAWPMPDGPAYRICLCPDYIPTQVGEPA